MRRFEFVGGTSAKFWTCAVDGEVFTIVYGRLGTDGQRKEKTFDTAAEAQKEHDKKVAEKLKEGYVEVDADDVPANSSNGPKGAAAASTKVLTLPPRPGQTRVVAAVDPALVAAAATATDAVVRAVSGRSWRRQLAAKEARRALRRAVGADTKTAAPLAAAIDRACVAVLASPSLSLSTTFGLLEILPAPAFAAALQRWQSPTGPAAPALRVLLAVRAGLADDELAFRVGRALTDRDISDDDATRRLTALRPFMDAQLARAGSTLPKLLASLGIEGDAVVSRRCARLAA
jgi:predicted DNA-binding WGR domain protein